MTNIIKIALRFVCTLPAAAAVLPCLAQEADGRHSWGSFDFKIKAGANIGGAAPMGIPAEIREIKKFNPLISLSIGASAVYWGAPRWGVTAGIRFENKSMATTARVKEYSVRIKEGSGETSGLFTGDVATNLKNGYLSIPLAACFKVIEPLSVHLGFYYAYLLDPAFYGSVYDGHIRQGEKGSEENRYISKDAPVSFAFSKELSRHDFGVTAGAEWGIWRHFLVSIDLQWGLRPIFPATFTGIKINMYNVYTALSFGYLF